jgi:hypothetical protein
MKLIYCKKCMDVISLRYEERKCECGESSGKYFEDGLHAVYSGPSIPLIFANSSFGEALLNQPESGDGEVFEAFVIPEQCLTFVKIDE